MYVLCVWLNTAVINFVGFYHDSVNMNDGVQYGKSKILYSKVSDKMEYANSVELDQTASSRAVYTVCHSTNNCIKCKI